MTTQSVARDRRQRMQLAGDWRPHDDAETQLFDASRQMLNSARRLERASGAPRSAGATDVSLGSLRAAFESLANASLMIRDAAAVEFEEAARSDEEREQLERLGGLLFAVDQNLHFAADACQLSRVALASLPDPRAASMHP